MPGIAGNYKEVSAAQVERVRERKREVTEVYAMILGVYGGDCGKNEMT